MPRTRLLPLIVCPAALAGVVTVHTVSRSDVLGGKAFGKAGPYERIVAKAYFAVDPALAANGIIRDIGLAPRNEKGFVEFSSDIYVLKPRQPAQANGTALYEVSNRGGKGMLATLCFAKPSLDPQSPEEFGDGYLLEQGYTLVWAGWQFDVPRKEGLVRLYPPAVAGVTGLVRSEFTPNSTTTAMPLADRNHVPYAAVDLSDPKAQMTVRDRPDGPRRTIPRAQWRFADAGSVSMEAGFVPGKIYEVIYTAKDPAVVGLGPAAVRDFISYLKYGGGDAVAALGDQRRFIKRAIGAGTSQSGRFLRHFLYDGFNADEKGRKVFDGVWPLVAGGGRGSFNHRFAQPSRDGHRMLNTQYPTDLFPFTDLPLADPETGATDGLLVRAQKENVTPRIFYTNGSYEYWGRVASLIHTTPDGRADAPIPDTTRIYFLTGTQHGSGSFPPPKTVTQFSANPNDFRPVLRALLAAMNEWLASGKEPPPSRYPRIDKGELVAPSALRFPKLPGAKLPFSPNLPYRYAFGPGFREKGIVSIEPPKLGGAFAVLVPQVDEDGNEIAGVRMPEHAVPLGVYAGWNLRLPAMGAPDELSDMIGAWFPFPPATIGARYQGREQYLERIRAAIAALVKDGFMLERDADRVVARAQSMWDSVTAKLR